MRHRPTVRATVRANCDGKRKGNEDGGKAPIVLKEDVGIAREISETSILRKEVIQPQVPLRLPCYDFTPVMNHTVANVPPKVRLSASGATHSHGVTGGVYKARERIHRGMLIRDY